MNADGKVLSVRDTRETIRQRVLLGGTIVSGDGTYSQKCVIGDISSSGARLAVSEFLPIANPFFLVVMKSQIAFDAEIVWRNARNAGLRFLGKHPLSTLAGSSHGFLRRIMIESCLR